MAKEPPAVRGKRPAVTTSRAGNQWRRTQRIRTAAGIAVEASIVELTEVPTYLRIAEKARHLRDLGMSDKAIGRALGVSDKTVAKAVVVGRREISSPAL